jgi:hypothetical protein
MKRLFAGLLLVAFLAISGSAYAQETKKDDTKTSQASTQTAKKSNKAKKAKKAKKGDAGTSNSTSTSPK